MDKSTNSESFFHLRNWENYSSNNLYHIDYYTDVNWVYRNIPSGKVKWSVWNGGYDGYNVIDRRPYYYDSVYQYDATSYELNFIQNTSNIYSIINFVDWR